MQQLAFRTVGFGTPACDELEAFVREAKADDPFAPVTVLVHNNFMGVAWRRELVRRRAAHRVQTGMHPGLVAVQFWTLRQLADELVAAPLRQQGLRSVDGLMVTAAIRQELAEAPGMFAEVADHASTETALARAFAEVRTLRRDQRALLTRSPSARVREVVEFAERVARRLRGGHFYDVGDLFERAASTLLKIDGDAVNFLRSRLGATVLHLPRALSPLEVRLVQALAGSHPVAVHLGVTDNPEADRGADGLFTALSHPLDGSAADATESAPDETSPASAVAVLGGRTGAEATADRVISVTDPDEEVRTVVRLVLEDLDAGVAADDIAVLFPSRDPYARSMTEQLDAAGVAWNGDAAQTLAESLVGRFVLGLMRLAMDERMRRVDVMALLTDLPVGAVTEADGGRRVRRPVRAAAWERLARSANVVEGDHWVPSSSHTARVGDDATRLGRFAKLLDRQIVSSESDPDASDARPVRLRADRERCSELAEFIWDLSQRIAEANEMHTWRDLSDWLRLQITHYLGVTTDEHWNPGGILPQRAGDVHADGEHSGGPTSGAEADTRGNLERTAAQRIDAVIGEMGELGAVEPDASTALMYRSLQSQLSNPHGRGGSVSSGVFVGKIGSDAQIPRRRVHVMGLAEGAYPARISPDSLIADADRHPGALVRRSDRVDAQHRDLLAAWACCTEVSTAFVPRGDLRRNAENVPSRWLLRTVRQLAAVADAPSDDFSGGFLDAHNLTAVATSGSVPSLEVVHSFMGGLRNARFPSTHSEFDSKELLGATSSSEGPDRHWLFTDNDEQAFRRGVELWRGRESGQFTRFDGNLADALDTERVLAEVISASRLETWATCPRRYLFSYLLGIDEIIEPESVVRLSPLDRGLLIHESLDEFLSELIRSASASHDLPGEGRDFDESDRMRLLAIGAAKAAALEAAGATGLPMLWSFDRETALGDLVEVLERDEQRSADHQAAVRGKVIASEHRFGFDTAESVAGGAESVPFEVEPGWQLRFRGAIDRVERIGNQAGDSPSDDGWRLAVIDYKSGSERPYVAIREPSSRARRFDDPTLRGTKLQLGVYALAAAHHFTPDIDVAEAVGQAAYWFVSARADWAWVTREMNEEYFDRFSEAVRSISRGIASGVFVGYVHDGDDRAGFVACPYCNPDGIGTAHIARQWKRKRTDPALDSFFLLSEGPIGEDTEGSQGDARRSPRAHATHQAEVS